MMNGHTGTGLRAVSVVVPLMLGVLAGRGADTMWTNAVWIGDGKALPPDDAAYYADDPAPRFRKSFALDGKVRAAHLRIVGLGYHLAHVNGRALADNALAPLWTPFGKRVCYDTYDVTQDLRQGTNVLAIELGNGWYNPLPLRMWGHINLRAALAVGRPCLAAVLSIEYADGRTESLATDSTWRMSHGPVIRNSIYLGEVYDARRETPGWRQPDFNDTDWAPAAVVEGPKGRLEPRSAPAIITLDSWPARKVTELRPGTYVADMGRNFAGIARFRLGPGTRGESVTFTYGELLNADGSVNGLTGACGQIKRAGRGGPGAPDVALQRDSYIRGGDGDEAYAPRFTWHGFRYVQIEGARTPPEVEGVALGSGLADASEFECSSEFLNELHRVCRNTFLSNTLGVQSDCPARERFGYGGDIAATAPSLIFDFDMQAFYAKALLDFADEAAGDGWFTETAPYVGIASAGYGGRSGPIGWTVAVPIMMDTLYRYYGDIETVRRHYDACARYVTLLREKFPDNIVKHCIGDHEALEKAPTDLTATAHYHQWATLTATFAKILGRGDDAANFGALADAIRNAFRERFVVGGRVGKGRQGEQVFGLYHDLIPERDREAALAILKADIAAKGNALSTGIFGTQYLLEVLSREGMADIAGTLVTRREFPGWGYMLDNGATTLWENWKGSDNVYSQNHPMFGSTEQWLMHHVLGLSPAADAVGFDKAVLDPKATADLTWARGLYRSIHGPIRVAWRMEDGHRRIELDLPRGVTARIRLTNPDRWVEAGPGHHTW